jgi:prepilin-type N-terminal cleavage/methylation domain-containing protein
VYLAHRRERTGPAARGAFTLIELLIVLALITVLIALTAGTVLRVIDTQQRSNTQTALAKVQSALTRQWAAYKDQFFKEDAPRLYPKQWNAVMAIAGNDPARARVIWVKVRQKQTFPISFNEALTPITLAAGVQLPPLPAYVSGLGAAGITAADSGACESSACLLLALQQSPSGGGVKLDDLGVNSSIKVCPTNLGKQINALVDGYGTPLQFCRWPTGSAIPLGNSALGQLGAANDPTDPQGTLTVQSWLSSAGRTQFQALCHIVPNRLPAGNTTQPASNVLIPLVASAGADKLIGLNATNFSPDPINYPPGSDNDNLYSRQ